MLKPLPKASDQPNSGPPATDFEACRFREPTFAWFYRQNFSGGEALSLAAGELGFDAELKRQLLKSSASGATS